MPSQIIKGFYEQLIHAYYLHCAGFVVCTSSAKRGSLSSHERGSGWAGTGISAIIFSDFSAIRAHFSAISELCNLRSQLQQSVKKRVISKLAIKILTYSNLPEVHRTRHRFLTVQAAVTPTRVLPAPVCEETTGTLCSSTSQTVLYNL